MQSQGIPSTVNHSVGFRAWNADDGTQPAPNLVQGFSGLEMTLLVFCQWKEQLCCTLVPVTAHQSAIFTTIYAVRTTN
jgi:hypothetical protein